MDKRIKSIEFIEDTHEYWFVDSEGHHRQLKGITSAIGKFLEKDFPDTDTVKIATVYGSAVHKAVENYLNSGNKNLSSEGEKWVIAELEKLSMDITGVDAMDCCEGEVMVSDFETTASKVDIVLHSKDGAYLFDIKTTSHFDRFYCSLQLSVYKKLYEENYGENVKGMFVLSTKQKRKFRIIEQSKELVDKILSYNRTL